MTTKKPISPRDDWRKRISLRSDEQATLNTKINSTLQAPAGLVATPGQAQITLRWLPVEGAIGYIIFRSFDDDGFVAINHGGSDVLAVPELLYADTDIVSGTFYSYRVAATASLDIAPGPMSKAVTCQAVSTIARPLIGLVDSAGSDGDLDRVWHMIGSERLSQLDEDFDVFGNPIGKEFSQALSIASSELGATMVRAHAIYHDDLEVFSWKQGNPKYNFTKVDAIFDKIIELGLRPVVELSFMPYDLATDPNATVFDYRGIISPPRDWAKWAELNFELGKHLVERYGIDEVSQWAFEVWNEPNLDVFWTGTQKDYFQLYDLAAMAIKEVDSRLIVGGPATAAGEWLYAFIAHVADNAIPLDFLSTHTYGNTPLDVRPILAKYHLEKTKIWWTEWGVGSTHFGPIHDTALGAPFILRGFKAVQGRVDAVAYWVISDHFEELGRPPRLFHNGFGLLSVGNLRKPRFWAVRLAQELGDHLLPVGIEGDGAESLVEIWATKSFDGQVDVLLWNSTLNASKFEGDAQLERTVSLDVVGLEPGIYKVFLARVDSNHSNIIRHCPPEVKWPNEKLWKQIATQDQLWETTLDDLTITTKTKVNYEVILPMPAVVRIRFKPS